MLVEGSKKLKGVVIEFGSAQRWRCCTGLIVSK
jgi:hypothetical protein